eukprot:XP_017945923.1 PREDICTED: uncharacterized protein LOC108645351 [Xenopus tropicalis]
MFGLMGLMIPLFLLASALFGTIPEEVWLAVLGRDGAEALALYLSPLQSVWSVLPEGYVAHVFVTLAILSVVFVLLAQRCFRTCETLGKKQRRYLLDRHAYVNDVVAHKKKQLYEDYLKQSVGEHDMS